MNMDRRHLLVFTVLAGVPLLLGAAAHDKTPPPLPNQKAAAPTHPQQSKDDWGDVIFEQQCSRCHNAPEGFSPRISGTVIRHMRVRASLSKHEEEELLHFLNP